MTSFKTSQFSITNALAKSVAVFTMPVFIFTLGACTTADLYEKTVAIPSHKWTSDYKPEFTFTITDTTALYQAYLVIRHTEKYNFNNIWLNYYYQPPCDTLRKETREFQLATNEKGWLGTGLDDIYEHRIKLTPAADKVRRSGNYKFILENIMREDPLKEILNVGIRIEKQ